MFRETNHCRISGNKNLVPVISLGEQYLTGVFPKSKDEQITKGPLDLVWCPESGLLQLKQSYSLDEMYGDNYGYRSGLNTSMVSHLVRMVEYMEQLISLSENDLVLDIGSNDATLLKAYHTNCKKVGIDPTGSKFSQYYTDEIVLIPDFFSAERIKNEIGNKKAKIITSIAMFYDLEDPTSFVQDVESILDDEGIWHFEQSYMPSMLRTNAYDTICHEHLEFYSLKVIRDLLKKCNLRLLKVDLNDINGGSFAVTACKENSKLKSDQITIDEILQQEKDMHLDTIDPYLHFGERVFDHRDKLKKLIDYLLADGKRIFGYGASTKGNVLMQFCGFTPAQIPYIAEINEDKFGAFTPGTNIPIISEKEARSMNPDYFLVLPWHFKESILQREKEFLKKGGKFIFPLPEIEILEELEN